MADLDGSWRVKRTGGILPPLFGVRKEISGRRGETRVGAVVSLPFDVDGLYLRYRGPFSAFVDELRPSRDGYSGRALFRNREYGRFEMTRDG